MAFGTADSEKMRITSNGSVGIGTTSLNWNYGLLTPLQIRNASIYAYDTYELGIQTNAYYDGSWKYQSTNTNTTFQISLGNGNAIKFNYANSGSAGGTFTWSEAMRITSTGNVGVGVSSLGSWDSTIKAIEVGTTGNFYGGYNSSASVIYLGTNAYYNSGWKYATSLSYKAQLLDAGGGNWHFQNAASGSAGGAITWTSLMKITDAGNLNFYNSTSQLAFYGANNFQINFGMVYNGSNLIATATAGGRIVMTDVGYEFKTFSGVTVGNTVTDASRMKITNEGYVGIGTTSPSVKLEVYDTASSMTNNPGNSQIRASASSTQWLSLGYDTSVNAGFIQSAQSGVAWRPTVLNRMGGNVMIGTGTDNGYKLNVGGSIYAETSIVAQGGMYAGGGIGFQGNLVGDYGYSIGMNSNTQVAGNAWYMQISTSWSNNFRFFYGGTGVGAGSAKAQIDTSGNYSALSDINKKKDIVLSTLGLNEILQLKPSTFKFKDDENEEEQIGFIAQEVKDVIPHAYYEDVEGDDKFIGLKYNAIVPVLVKAIQELKAEIEILKNS